MNILSERFDRKLNFSIVIFNKAEISKITSYHGSIFPVFEISKAFEDPRNIDKSSAISALYLTSETLIKVVEYLWSHDRTVGSTRSKGNICIYFYMKSCPS